jgi:hypothetical protein
MPVSIADLKQVTLAAPENAEKVLLTLRKEGIAILPGFLEREILEGLNREFETIIDKGQTLGFNVTERDEAVTVAIVRNRLATDDYPVISRVFTDPLMAEVAESYYDGESFALNHQIYANLNSGTREAISDLPFIPHLDKIQTLKFFIYLTDTTAENGAMGVIPGSHHLNREHRLRCLEINSDFRTVTNIVSEVQTIPAEGSAGTLLIFDTDITHTAGHVLPGYERRVLRGHTRLVMELEKLGLGREAIGITT